MFRRRRKPEPAPMWGSDIEVRITWRPVAEVRALIPNSLSPTSLFPWEQYPGAIQAKSLCVTSSIPALAIQNWLQGGVEDIGPEVRASLLQHDLISQFRAASYDPEFFNALRREIQRGAIAGMFNVTKENSDG